MSTKMLSACWPLKLTPILKLVLISLADQSNDEGISWPSIGSMELRTCLSERSIRRAMRKLEKLNYLRTKIRAGHSSVYRIYPSGDTRTPVRPTPVSRPPTPATQTPTPVSLTPPGGPHRPPEPSVEPSRTIKEPKALSGKDQSKIEGLYKTLGVRRKNLDNP